MIKTKTIKTPLIMASASGLTSCSFRLVLESKLSHSLEVQYGLVPKLSHHGGKNHRPAGSKTKSDSSREYHIHRFVNTVRSRFFSETKWNGVFPLRMFSVAKQRVVMAGLVLRACTQAQSHGISAMLEEQKHQQRGFLGFC